MLFRLSGFFWLSSLSGSSLFSVLFCPRISVSQSKPKKSDSIEKYELLWIAKDTTEIPQTTKKSLREKVPICPSVAICTLQNIARSLFQFTSLSQRLFVFILDKQL